MTDGGRSDPSLKSEIREKVSVKSNLTCMPVVLVLALMVI